MKIIHTSDWHLGHSFYGYERTEEHLSFLKQLCQIICNENPDALIVSGDIYDSVVPSITAQKLYNRMILELRAAAPTMKIIITAGNHDSSSRLELNGELWNAFDVKIIGNIERIDNNVNYEKHIIKISDSDNKSKGYIIAVPYIYHANYPATNDETHSRMRNFHQELINRVKERNTSNRPIIMTGHLAVSGADIKGHETKHTRLVYESLEEFGEGYDYLALGHIHRPQAVTGNKKARYSGSPIPMSFDEDYPHTVSILEIENNGSVPIVREIKTDPLIPICIIPEKGGDINEILERIASLPNEKSYIRIKLKVKDVIPMNERLLIENSFSGKEAILCEIQPIRETSADSAQRNIAIEEIKNISPLEIAMDYYQQHFGSKMDEELQQMLRESIDAVEKEHNNQ
ncbi:MAG: exonuclease SbcCD subunit D C-terminal domain-containing protein [Bacteroidaceae bacterium]|nr:exonuclease SbcCD subunit D C-terminal domain-containing protein [Bacteroidaceae bacterium]